SSGPMIITRQPQLRLGAFCQLDKILGVPPTKHTPSANISATSVATLKASRVLPIPPVPVSVSKRDVPSSCFTSEISRLRPIKRRLSVGRLYLASGSGDVEPPLALSGKTRSVARAIA